MKKYFPLISALADKHINPSVEMPLTKSTHKIKNEFVCPSSYGVENAVILLASCFNSYSGYYKSPALLKKALENLTQAIKVIDKGSYEPISFCLSVINASYVYRLVKTYSNMLCACDKQEALNIQKIALDYLAQAKEILLKLKTDNIYLYAAMLHIAKDLKDDGFKQIVENVKQAIESFTGLSDQYIHVLCDIHRETKDKSFLKAAQSNMVSVLKLLEPDDGVICVQEERDNLKTRSKPLYLQHYLNSLIYISFISKDENLEKALFYTCTTLGMNENLTIENDLGVFAIPALFLLNRGLLDMEVTDISRREALSVFNGYIEEYGIYRHGTGSNITQTIFAGQEFFYSMQCGALKTRLRLNVTFFGPRGRFKSENIEQTDKGFRLHFFREWGYFLPLEDRSIPPIIGTDVNKEDREMTNLQYFEIDVDISLKDNGADIIMSFSKTDELACKLDFVFDGQGFFDSDSASIQSIGNDFIQLQKGAFTYSIDSDYITAGPAFNGSSISSESLRGSNPPVEGAFTVYFTDMTPSSHKISIRGAKA